MTWFFALFTLSGISFIFWALMGVFRFVAERLWFLRHKDVQSINITLSAQNDADWDEMTVNYKPSRKSRRGLPITTWKDASGQVHYSSEFALPINLSSVPLKSIRVEYGTTPQSITIDKVAAIVPAHNEEDCIAHSLANLSGMIPVDQIYVASDGSTDKTVEIARHFGCHVADIQPNKGKAGALVQTIEEHNLLDRYDAVLILDADSELQPDYLKNALPFFDDPEIVAVAGHVNNYWTPHWIPKWSKLFTAYRIRLYFFLQVGMKYGQTWKHTNATAIVPGFGSMYRTSAIREIDIDAPGLIIEDFNMTFEVHHKKLGKIAYHPKIFGVSHDPFTLRDYIKQVKRWNLGFWQTIKRHGVWPSFFWVSVFVFQIEMISLCFILLSTPFLLFFLALDGFQPLSVPWSDLEVTLSSVLIGLFFMDYLMTVFAAYIERKPVLLLYGFGFFFLRIIDAALYLYSIPAAYIIKSNGKWTSPKRKLAT